MKTEYTYLIINFLTILFPFAFSFHPKIRFYRKWKYLFPGLFIVAVFFIVWDMIFTAMGVWHFNPKYITGLSAGNLPVEEVLFFFTIPYACIFLYDAVVEFIRIDFKKAGTLLYWATIIFLIMMLVLYHDRIYTAVTFSLLAVFMVLIKYILKVKTLYQALISYSVLLIPFFLVNGYLTGMFSQEPVVLYNNNENMGIRMITIPVEDTFYGLLLFLMNVALFEKFKRNFESKPAVAFD